MAPSGKHTQKVAIGRPTAIEDQNDFVRRGCVDGELAALINLANGHPRSKETGVQVTLVAGARNRLDLQLRLLTTVALERGAVQS